VPGDISAIRPAHDLCEQVPGICDGMFYPDAVAEYGAALDGPDVAMSPGAESARELDARVRTAVQRLLREHHDQTLLVVSHGGFVGAACMYAVGAPGLADVYPFRLSPENTSLSTFAPSAAAPPWLLERFNDAAHLDADGAPIGGAS
jgi:broad specificity phosphatase PhoE